MNKLFAQRLVEARKKKGMSQHQVADRLKLSRGRIGNYEQATREPDTETLTLLADFYNVSVDYLLGLSENPTPVRFQSAGEKNSYYVQHSPEESLRNAVKKALADSDSSNHLSDKLNRSISVYGKLSSPKMRENMIDNLATIIEMYAFEAEKNNSEESIE